MHVLVCQGNWGLQELMGNTFWSPLLPPVCQGPGLGWVPEHHGTVSPDGKWDMIRVPVLLHGFMESTPQPTRVVWQRCAHKIPSVMWGSCKAEYLGLREEGHSWRPVGERQARVRLLICAKRVSRCHQSLGWKCLFPFKKSLCYSVHFRLKDAVKFHFS